MASFDIYIIVIIMMAAFVGMCIGRMTDLPMTVIVAIFIVGFLLVVYAVPRDSMLHSRSEVRDSIRVITRCVK